jgi:outer membrane autotransporter protein
MASIGGMPFGFANESFNPNLIANGTGTVTVTGAGSTLDVTSSDTLYVGYSGTGTLDVKSGGTVTADTALVGFRPGVTGSVTVQDSGSTFSASGQTVVGAWGTGNLNITNGGQVTTDTLSVGGFDPTTITLAADVAGGLTNPNGTGQVTVTGTGSSLSITGQNPLTLGAGGTGTLTVSNGGQVTSPDNFVGGYLKFTPDPVSQVKNVSILSGTGTAQVTGAGSQWHTNALVVGVGGAGTLDISNGGQADSHLAAAGMGAQSTGTATVTGSGSAWTIAPGTDPETDAGHGELMVGGWGQGNLTVASGGRVDAAKMAIGGFDLATISGANTVWNFGTPTGTGTVTVTGASSGTASQLNVTGSGPLAVGYSGTGTLNVSDGGHVASGDGFLGYLTGSNGTVNVNGTDSKWNVAGNLYVGGTAEAAGGTGLLNVANGGLVDVTGDMTVWQTGTLRGNGTVTVETPTTLHNYGTIAPGSSSSIGTLTVNGNVVFEPGSTYAVKIGQSSSDKLEVNGDTTINGGTVKVSSLGTVVGEHSYQIIHADSVTVPTGGGFGAPDTALLTFAVSDSSLAYDPTSVVLHLTAANFNDPTIAQTPNQQQLGGALQDIANAGGNGVTHALQQVETPEGLRQAYNQLSGQSRPPLTPVAATGSSRFLGTVSDRMQSLQTGLMSGMSNMSVVAMSGPDSRMDGGQMYDFAAPGQSVAIGNGSNLLADSPWGLWGRGYGLFGDRETEKDAPGYSYQMYGGSLGLDYQFTEKFLGGVVVGVTDGNVDFAGMRDNADFQAIQVGLYGDLTWEKWYLNSMATYANLHYDTERFVDLTGERLTGDLSGNDWSAYVEGGKNVNLSPSALLQPFVSLQYSYLTFGSYTETGGASALSYGDQTSQSVKGSLGARLTDRLFESPGGFHADGQLRGRWIHEFGDDQSKVDTSFASNPGAVFTIHDAEIARDSALVGVGISANITKQLRASADYDALLNTDETVQLVSAALEYRW